MCFIDIAGVIEVRAAHGGGQCGFVFGNGNKVDVIGHEAVAVNAQSVCFAFLFQKLQVHAVVVVGKKHILPVVASLRDMMINAGHDDSCVSGHGFMIAEGCFVVKRMRGQGIT